MQPATAADLVFDAARHVYTLYGVPIPSVTQILKATGVSTDFEGLKATSQRRRQQIDARRDLGTVVHAACHAYDDDDLAWESLTADVQPFVEAWAEFRRSSGLMPKLRERILYHGQRRYCGTTDGIFVADHTGPVMVDIKIGDPEDAGARFQLAGYCDAFLYEHRDHPPLARWSVQLCPERAVPYLIDPYHDYSDFTTWHAIVVTYYANATRRRLL